MELWMDLLFGNAVGLFSVITIGATLLIILTLLVMFILKSRRR